MESSTNHGSTVLNKILIPVITTVLGATAIYFLGFNKKNSGRTDMEQMLISKDATLKAWRSFVTSENIYYKNAASVEEEYTQKIADAMKQAQSYAEVVPVFRSFEKDYSKETKKSTQDIENIVTDKDIDRDFLSMLNRILDYSKDHDEKMADFFDNFASLAKSNRTEAEKGEKIKAEIQSFTETEKRMGDRTVTETEGIAKILSERYNQAFNLNELDVYVDYKKEKDKKEVVADPGKKTEPTDPAPPDPGKQTEYKPDVQNDVDPNRTNPTNNQIEPTITLLAGQWEMTGAILELSRNGDMYWTLDNGKYTTGDWKLMNGQIRMNATNPDTKKTTLMIGDISNFTRSSFTLTLLAAPKEVYRFRKKADY